MSGIGGHGGIVDFNTYFVGSGTGHGACGGQCSGRVDATRIIAFSICFSVTGFSHLHFFFGCLQVLHAGRAGWQPHIGFGLLHTLQLEPLANPSVLLAAFMPAR
jgi:hypothetical protein